MYNVRYNGSIKQLNKGRIKTMDNDYIRDMLKDCNEDTPEMDMVIDDLLDECGLL